MRLILISSIVMAGCLLSTMSLSAAVQAEVEVAEAELGGTLTVTCPRAGLHHLGVVYRDVIPDEKEQYTLLVNQKPVARFTGDVKPGSIWGDDRLFVWFSEQPYEFKGGEKVQLKLAGTQKGPHQVFALYFVQPAALAKVQGLVSRSSLVLKERRLFTRIVGASDGPGAKHYPLPASPDYLEMLAAGAELQGFAKKKATYTIWGQYVSVVGQASDVNLLTYTAPRPEGHTKPIVTLAMTDNEGALFGNQPFHVATRGTTRYLNTQLSPQFPGILQTTDGANKAEIEQALEQRKKGQRVQFGRPVDWDKKPTIWVVGRIGLDMYPEDAEATLKARPDLQRAQVLTAYVIRVSDGSPDKTKWPLFYWNSWFHGSEGEIHNEEITRLLADQFVEPGQRLWFYYDWRPGEKSYTAMMRPRDVHLMTKGGIPGRWIQYGLLSEKQSQRVLLEPVGVWAQTGPVTLRDWTVQAKGADFYQRLLKEAGQP